ncbi:hypothetical protein HDU98_010320 [Podochytrium sp. JEL0797]|nr:hypothetical protein HDU98_010320 [Podochytrium sp. JEL0797]
MPGFTDSNMVNSAVALDAYLNLKQSIKEKKAVAASLKSSESLKSATSTPVPSVTATQKSKTPALFATSTGFLQPGSQMHL